MQQFTVIGVGEVQTMGIFLVKFSLLLDEIMMYYHLFQ